MLHQQGSVGGIGKAEQENGSSDPGPAKDQPLIQGGYRQ